MSEFLTLAPPEAAGMVENLNGCGQGELLNRLSKTPMARAEYNEGVGKGRNRLRIDTSYLSRFEGTNYVQWFGRVASGYFVPFGRIMEIMESRP